METNYFVKGQCDIELGNSFNLGAEIFNLVKNSQISQEDLGYYFAGIKDYINQKISHRNMQIKELKKLTETNEQRADRYAQGYKDGSRKIQEYARYCFKCQTITFHADTYGTRTKEGWKHYNCK